MQIEYARCMSKSECNDFFKSLIENSNTKINTYSSVIENNKDRLIDAYKKYQLIMSDNYSKIEQEFQEDYKAFINKKCVCGHDVKFISGFNFYGCVNYKSNVRHKNFIEKDTTPYRHRVEPSNSYITKILYDLDLKKVLNAKALFNFYTSLGFEDLCLKYNEVPYTKTINTYTNVKKSSSAFEKTCIEKLSKIYKTVIPQFGIIYKNVGEKEKKCFIDILCSNQNSVNIYECKTSSFDKNDIQKDLYISLINHIENKGRAVKFTYLFEK